MTRRTPQTPHARRAFGPGARRAVFTAAALAVAPLAACGHATTAAVQPTRPAAAVSAARHAQQVAIHEQVDASLRHLSNAHQKYGGIPSYLPKTTTPSGRIVHATAAHQVLAIQGDSVDVDLGASRARMTVVGPAVPSKVAGTDAEQTSASFDLTLANSHGSIPVSAGAFSVVDDLGHLHSLTVRVKGGGRAPARVSGRGPVTLVLRGTLPSGDGKLRYRPTGRPLVAWDFVVETD